MSSSDGEGPGQKPKQPASGTLAGMPPPKEPTTTTTTTTPARAPLPPPKAPPGGRPHAPTSPPALRREASGAGPLPQPPPSGPHALPSQALPSQAPPSGPHAMPPPSGPHALPPPPAQTAPLAFPSQLPSGAPASFAAQVAGQHQPAFTAPPPPAIATQHGLGALGQGPQAGDSMEEVPGSQFVKFLKISLRRAFRLRIEPREVLPSERASLERAQPPILDASLQAFLAWRRSVLFLVAVALVPLSIIGVVDAMAGSMPSAIRVVKLGPALAEALFCWLCWSQLKRWSHWRTQRRKLFLGWLLFLAMPFVVFLYPLRTVLVETAVNPADTIRALGVDGTYRRAVMPFVFAMIAMLQLAPKAISLMPGLIRAALVIKLLFPGSTGPGWLIVMCAPLYALLAYVTLIIPYQFTGSGWFIFGVLGLVAGQILLARAGFSLARPLAEAEALKAIRRVRTYYLAVMILSAVLIVVALLSLVDQLNMRITDVITAVMKFETNVLILTMIGADLVVTNLDRARSHTVGKGHVEEEAEVKIAAFVSLEAPPTPPPPGPAP